MTKENTTAATRKSRQTGATVSAFFDDFLGWVSYCETHKGYAEHASKTAAISWLSSPVTWCQGCQEGAK
jgi:hypothetical protein